MPKIGVFDSGVGGLSVANAIQVTFPDAEVLYTEDHDNVPYGSKSPEKLFDLVLPILNALSKEGCDVIVVACNTVSTTILDKLQAEAQTPLLGVEPMVEAASKQTKSGVIAVCATPTTLASSRYRELKTEFAANIKVLEPDCSDWSSMIENTELSEHTIAQRIDAVCEDGADVIVLGCTHYHWIEDMIVKHVAGRATVLQPEPMIIEELQRRLGL